MAAATILVPLDGSEVAESALLYVKPLMPLGLFSVELLHAEEPDRPESLHGRTWDAAVYLEQVAEQFRAETGLVVECLTPKAVPYAAVLARAEDPRVSMIVMTTMGLSGPKRWRIGSVADKVIRGAACPIFTIGPETRGAPLQFERVLVPLDGSELAEEALPYARTLAQKLDAGIQLVRAVTNPAVPEELAGTFDAELVAGQQLISSKYLDEVKLELETPQAVERVVQVGPAAEVVIAQAIDSENSLVVMSSHGRHGLVRFALGSVAQRVIEASPSPVLLVRPGQWPRFAAFEKR